MENVSQEQRPSLEIHDYDGTLLRRLPLDWDHMVMGRSENADICLKGNSISRRHAEVVRKPEGAWVVRDLESLHGIKVNDTPIKEHTLSPGDRIQLEQYTLVFKQQESQQNTIVMWKEDDQKLGLQPEEFTELGEVDLSNKIDTLHLFTLTEFGQRLAKTSNPKERLQMLTRFMIRKDFHGKSAMALRVTSFDSPYPPEILGNPVSQRDWDDSKTYVSQNLIRALRRSRSPVLASSKELGAIEFTTFGVGQDISAVACPLLEHKDHIDVLYVVLPPEYGTAEWLALIALAANQYQNAEAIWRTQAEARELAAAEQDVASARKIQRMLIPRTSIKPQGLDISIGFLPCPSVGGDYLDVIKMSDGRILLVAADVAGEGLPAVLVAQSLHSMVHILLRCGVELSQILNGLNEHFREFLEEGSFLTLACAIVDPSSGEFEYVDAGHLPLLVVQSDGQTRLCESDNLPALGVESASYTVRRDKLEAGQLLVIITDGVLERPQKDAESLRLEDFQKEIVDLYTNQKFETSRELGAHLMDTLKERNGKEKPADDQCFILARYTGW